ncbi:MAG TPA: hypothetical protein DDX40_06660 [Rikenellaceae bacterium]|nr:hypothetical protein [Rikenellaceae bacterium]
MEFTGSIQFADESSWLTLTTESDDTVTITVKFGSRLLTSQEVLSFDVTPNSGIVRLPAGEILRALMGNGVGMVTGSFTATQGSSSCSHSFSVLPCRKFSYKSLAATIFTTRPTKSPVYEGAKDRLYFYRTSGDVSTYVRFNYLNGATSSSYKLSPTYYVSGSYYDLDISADTMLATASAKGLNVSNIASYDVWIEYSGSKSTVYSFDIKRMRLPLKTYMFLGRRGTYEYIHATGKFGRSIESETQVFVTSGIEQELENDSTMNFEQNSGHIDSVGMNAYWLEFLASKERYIIEKDGTERAIVVDEFKTSLTDRAVSSLTFTWHYANPNNTVIDNVDVELTGLTISGSSTVNNDDNTAQFTVTYTPSNSTQRGVLWSVESGSAYASIDESGKLTALKGANGNTVKIRATSKENSSIYAEKSVSVTYKAASVSVTGVRLNKSVLSLAVGESETLVATVMPERATDQSVTWQSSNKNVATVNQNGLVTAVGAGSAVIGVKTTDGEFTATCALTVTTVVKEYTLTVNCVTSGATIKVLEYVAGQTTVRDAVDYTGPMTFKENTTIRVWAYKQGMINSGTQTVLMTSDKTVSVACKTIPTWNLAAGSSADSGGDSLPCTVSDPDSVGWRLVSDADWISVDSDTAIEVSPNTSSDSRTGHVKLICDAVETDYVVATCEISQPAAEATIQEPSIEFESDSISVAATTTEATVLFLAKNLTGLTAACSGALVNASARANAATRCIGVSFAANTSTSERTGTITISGTRTDGRGTYSKSFTIVQAAAAAPDTYLLTVNVQPSGASVYVTVGSGSMTEYTGPVAVEAGASVRVVAYKTGYVSKSQTVTMDSDKTLDWTLPVAPSWTLTSQTFEAGGDGAAFEITDDESVGWKVVCPDWCRLDDEVYEGTGAHSSGLVATANDTGAERSGYVYLYAAGSNNYVAVCKVTQAAAAPGPGDSPTLPDGYTAVDFIASRGASGSLLGDLPYIDTGVTDRSDQTYHVEFTVFPNSESGLSLTTYPFTMGSASASKTGSSVKQIFTGNFPGGNSYYGTSGLTGDQSGAWGGNRSGGNCIVLFGVLAPGERHTLEWNYDQGEVSVDGNAAAGKIVGTSAAAVGTSNSCFLFAVNMAGSPVDGNGKDMRRGWQKLHRLWIKDGAGALLCDLHPCRNEYGAYGLCDLVSGAFLTSANDKAFSGPDDE